MTHSGSSAEPITIYPYPPLAKVLSAPKLEAVLAWFRLNGVDPACIPSDEQVVISDVIDFWWVDHGKRPDPSWSALERRFAAGEFPLSHHQALVTVPLTEQVEAALREIQAQADASQQTVEAQLSAAGIIPGASERPWARGRQQMTHSGSRKFRKKPVVIEAMQYTGDNGVEIGHFAGITARIAGRDRHLEITTLEGIMKVSPGDWIIQGVQGEFYPCKPEIFALTYEPVE